MTNWLINPKGSKILAITLRMLRLMETTSTLESEFMPSKEKESCELHHFRPNTVLGSSLLIKDTLSGDLDVINKLFDTSFVRSILASEKMLRA